VSDLRLAVLGDSIAYGQGARRPADAPGPRLVAALAEAGVAAELAVAAVPGARSADLDAQVARAVAGRPPDVAVIVIGANDLAGFVPADRAAGALERALVRLQGAGAEIVVAPAPDLSVVPWVPQALRATVRAASRSLRAAQLAVVRAVGARVADVDGTTAAAFAADPKLFSADRFHPSSAGYAVIAASLAPEVIAAAERVRARRL
jgi:lysophospholipase L1-like esterase